jgi:hypothetical protein
MYHDRIKKRIELIGIKNGMDLHSCRQWFDENIGPGDEAFKAAVVEAEAEILLDLESESVLDEIWTEAQRFVEEVFQPDPAPKPKTTRIKIGRNDACPCGSGKKYKKCHLAMGTSPEPQTA